jgi:S1-C subfamily serine protease
VVLKSLGVEGKKGAYVESVSIGSPADKSGILPGDFIVSLDGRAVEGNEQLTRMVGDIPAGTKSEFKLFRAGAERKVSVKIEERDDKKVGDNSKLYPGLILIPADSELLSSAQNGGKKLSGLIVAAVIPKSPAAGMGLALGDQLTEVNGKKVSSLKEYYEALNASSGKLSFGYDRDGQSFESPAYIKK